MGWSSQGPKCSRCHEYTSTCAKCTGDGTIGTGIGLRMSCHECDGTGYRCSRDGGRWK